MDMVNNYTLLKEIINYAKENKVPIMQSEGIDFVTTFIIKNQIRTILEIGSGIGFSAIMMALCHTDIRIVSIERDQDRYLEAVKNIKKFGLEDRITLIYNDAFNVKLTESFDMILIDAAKAQNQRFFELFKSNLKEKGYILTDNMYFHGLVSKDEKEIKSRNLRGIVKKIKEYITFLNKNEEFTTTIYEVGDGIAVSEKK